MPTFTTNLKITRPIDNESAWGATLNANSDLIDGLSPIGSLFVSVAESPSTTLHVRVTAGSYRKADGTIGVFAGTSSFSLSPSVTNYVWLTDSGTLTAGTAWPTGSQVRLAVVQTGSTTVTSVADSRFVCMSCTG